MDTYIISRDQLKKIVDICPELYPLARAVQKQSVSEDKNCIMCGAGLEKRWHRLTPVLIQALIKAYQIVVEKKENHFSKRDLDLDHNEYGNFQKLRFHALIAKHKVNGEWHKGDWVITRRGFLFLQGRQSVPTRVQTFRNRVIGHDPELAYIKDIINSQPEIQTVFPFEIAEPDQTDLL